MIVDLFLSKFLDFTETYVTSWLAPYPFPGTEGVVAKSLEIAPYLGWVAGYVDMSGLLMLLVVIVQVELAMWMWGFFHVVKKTVFQWF